MHVFLKCVYISAPPKEISASCSFCRLGNSDESKKLVFSEQCPTCNLSSAESLHFTKVMANVR